MEVPKEFWERDRRRFIQSTEPHQQIFYWRLKTPEASKALISLRYFPSGDIVSVCSLPDSHFSFSNDFKYAFSVLCGNFALKPCRTACFEWFMSSAELNFLEKKYIQFRLTGEIVSREILSEADFCHLINRLKGRSKKQSERDTRQQ